MLRYLFCIALLCIAAGGFAQQAGTASTAATVAEDGRREFALPGIAVAVVNSGGIVATGVAGVRKVGSPEPIAVSDVFHLGSVTKPFTATMIATVVDQGKLAWTSTPGEVFPEWKDQIDPALRSITLAQILAHQAGLQSFEDEAEYEALPKFTGTPKEQRLQFARYLLTRPPAVKPGTEYRYSNAGYTLAAAMAERVTGKSWEDLMQKRLFGPLHLASAGFGWPARRRPDAPWGHDKKGDHWEPQDPNGPYQLPTLDGPAGDVSMNVEDLAEFLRCHLRGLRGKARLLKPATFEELHAQYSPTHPEALGWDLQITKTGERISIKLGSAGTFFAIMMLSERRDLGIAVLINAPDQQAALTVVGRLLKIYSPQAAAR